MDVNLESQLNLKLDSYLDFRLILDDISPRTPINQVLQVKNELRSRLDLISEDRERLKTTHQCLIKERTALVQNFIDKKALHDELSSFFSRKNARQVKEMEIEAKVLAEICARKKALIAKMRGLLQSSPVKENNPKIKKVFKFECGPVKLPARESLSPCTGIRSARRQKVAIFRNSLCN